MKTIAESTNLLKKAKPINEHHRNHNIICLLCCESIEQFPHTGTDYSRCGPCAFRQDSKINELLEQFDEENRNGQNN